MYVFIKKKKKNFVGYNLSTLSPIPKKLGHCVKCQKQQDAMVHKAFSNLSVTQ